MSTPADAGPEDLIFVGSDKYVEAVRRSAAAAAIVPGGIDPPLRMSGIRVVDPLIPMARAIDLIVPDVRSFTEV